MAGEDQQAPATPQAAELERIGGRTERTGTRRFSRSSAVSNLNRLAFGITEGVVPEETSGRDAALRRMLVLADVLAVLVALYVSVGLLGAEDTLRLGSLALVPLVVVSSRLMGLYDRDEMVLAKTTLTEGPALFHLATLYALITYIGQDVFVLGEIGPGQGLCLWAAFLLSSVGCRASVRRLGVASGPPERCLVLSDDVGLERLRHNLKHGRGCNVDIVLELRTDELPEGPDARAGLTGLLRQHGIQRLIVATGEHDTERLLEIIRDTKGLGVKVSIKPRLLDVLGSAVEFEDVHGDVYLGVRRFGLSASERRTKRAMDMVGAMFMLLVTAPLFALFALAIKLDSPGPVLFRQVRVGRDGERFWIYKFRTMELHAEHRHADLLAQNEAGDGLFKMSADPRITRVGRLLRRTSLDELPQLVNVLQGQMALVGPRPLVVNEDERIHGWHRRRLHLTPGMTGLWQVMGSARIPMREMVALDYLYIVNWSVWNDVQILLRTVVFVLGRRGL